MLMFFHMQSAYVKSNEHCVLNTAYNAFSFFSFFFLQHWNLYIIVKDGHTCRTEEQECTEDILQIQWSGKGYWDNGVDKFALYWEHWDNGVEKFAFYSAWLWFLIYVRVINSSF